MAKYRKLPVVIDALVWNGNNLRTITAFMDGKAPDTSSQQAQYRWEQYEELVSREGLKIATLEGRMLADIGDYIIRGVNGEFYPCKPAIFNKTYELVSD